MSKALLFLVAGFVAVFLALPTHSASPPPPCYKSCKITGVCPGGGPCFTCTQCLHSGTGLDTCNYWYDYSIGDLCSLCFGVPNCHLCCTVEGVTCNC